MDERWLRFDALHAEVKVDRLKNGGRIKQ